MILPFSEEFIASAADVEKACFSSPWSEKSLRMLLNPPGYAFMCMRDGRCAAYCGMLIVADELQIMNIATYPEFRRTGCARELLSAVYKLAKEKDVSFITLDVRESNYAARNLYLSEKFEEIGIRPGYYFNPPESAVIMEKKL